MDEADILQRVHALVEREHDLRSRLGRGELTEQDEQAALRQAEEQLDQCWDLLRQRRARQAAGQDPDAADVRPAGEVEGYLQ